MVSLSTHKKLIVEAIEKTNWSVALKELLLSDEFSYAVLMVNDAIFCEACGQNSSEPVIQYGYTYTHVEHFSGFPCGYCDKPISNSEFASRHFAKNLIACDKCLNSLSQCKYCEGHYPSANLLNGYCVSCYTTCYTCGGRFPHPETMTARGRRHCKACGERDIWIQRYDFDPMTVLKFQGSPRNRLYFGVELEVEGASTPACVSMAKDLMKRFNRRLIVKHDGSLPGNGLKGLEIVTAPGSLEFQKKLWEEFFQQGYEFESFKSSHCSTHIHVSKAALKPLQIARMATFMYHQGNRGLIQAIGGRDLTNEWGKRYARIALNCQIKDLVGVYGSAKHFQRNFDMDADSAKGIALSPAQRYLLPLAPTFNKYSALNLVPKDTVEFRLFAGTNQFDTMMKNLEFVQAVIDYCDTAKVSHKQLGSSKEFLLFVTKHRSEYKHLFKFCVTKELISIPKGGNLKSA